MNDLRCVKCHRPMKHATESGRGPVCEKAAKPASLHERDLFIDNLTTDCAAALERLAMDIECMAISALMAVKRQAAAARHRLGMA